MTTGLPFILIVLFLLSCDPAQPEMSDKLSKFAGQEQYELITGLKFPKHFKLIANPKLGFDDFVRQTVIDLDKKDCIKFYKGNKFELLRDTVFSPFEGSSYSDSIYRQIPDKRKFIHLFGRTNYTNWFYLLDTTACRLYCLISYPDSRGYTK